MMDSYRYYVPISLNDLPESGLVDICMFSGTNN
jgi:hypothetical protein